LFGLGQNLSLIKGMPQETVKNLPPFKMRFTVVLSLEMAGFPGKLAVSREHQTTV
jgi:hypothetical protein